MAIIKRPFPTAGTPTVDVNYDEQNVLIELLASQGTDSFILISGGIATTPPVLKNGSLIRHNFSLYQVTVEDYILLTTTDTSGYVVLEGNGDSITAKWLQDSTGFTFDPERNGFYDISDNQLIRDLALLEGTLYTIGRIFGFNINQYFMEDGRFSYGFQDTVLFKNVIASSLSNRILGPDQTGNGTYVGLCTDGTNFISLHYYTSSTVYIHEGTSATISSSFVLAEVVDRIGYDGANLLAITSAAGATLYVYDGVSNTLASTLPNIFDDANYNLDDFTIWGGNLVFALRKNSDAKHYIFIHDGISSTVLSSFEAPSTTSGGVVSITTDNDGNLIILGSSDQGTSGSVYAIFVCDGLTPAVTLRVPTAALDRPYQCTWLDSRFHHTEGWDNIEWYIDTYGSTPVQ